MSAAPSRWGAREREGTPFVAWAPLAKGFFAVAGGAVAAIAARHGATPAQVALAWLLHSPATVAIPGTASLRHLEENVGAADLRLKDEEAAELTAHRSRGYRAQRLRRRARIALGRAKRRFRR